MSTHQPLKAAYKPPLPPLDVSLPTGFPECLPDEVLAAIVTRIAALNLQRKGMWFGYYSSNVPSDTLLRVPLSQPAWHHDRVAAKLFAAPELRQSVAALLQTPPQLRQLVTSAGGLSVICQPHPLRAQSVPFSSALNGVSSLALPSTCLHCSCKIRFSVVRSQTTQWMKVTVGPIVLTSRQFHLLTNPTKCRPR
jgi:hypothetical protein